MNQHPSTLLDKALIRLEGGERLHSILADYPDQADELASLLATVRQVQWLKPVPPPPQAEVGLATFLDQAQAMRAAPPPPSSLWRRLRVRWAAFRHSGLYPKVRLAWGGLAALLLLLGLLGSAITLAADSLPGDPLYPLKLAGEEIRLSLTRSETARAEYQLTRAQIRVVEMCRLAEKGHPVDQTSLTRLDQALETSLLIAASISPDQASHLLIAIEQTTASQLDRLASVEKMTLSRDTRQQLSQAGYSLHQTLALAQQGQIDWHTFRLNATLGLFQVGRQASAPDVTTR